MTAGMVAGAAVLMIVLVICYYNKLVKLRQRTRNAKSQIEIQLQKRFDLIPNLVETVRGYAAHEESVLEKLAELRSVYAGAQSVNEKLAAEKEITKSFGRVLGVAESYPQLKANENFLALQEEVKDTESKVAFARQFYNDIVTRYNTSLEVFPTNMIAKIFGFLPEQLFAAETEEAKEKIKIGF